MVGINLDAAMFCDVGSDSLAQFKDAEKMVGAALYQANKLRAEVVGSYGLENLAEFVASEWKKGDISM